MKLQNAEPASAWAIRNPFGKVPWISPYSVRRTRKDAILAFCYEMKNWKRFYRWGYRAIQVTVRDDVR